jgi:hypothetical protein
VRRDKPAGKEWMREPHVEGVANHGDPESCGDPRERAIEALTGARAGRATEPRNQEFRSPTTLMCRKATRGRA